MITAEDIARFIPAAVRMASISPCAKSKRGVVIIQDARNGPTIRATGYNAPPTGFACDGSEACRAACGKVCNHAEAAAIYDLTANRQLPHESLHMLHVKAVDGIAVASGPPSCWQCSRMIVDCNLIEKMWLLHTVAGGSIVPVAYTPDEFHEQTLLHCRLPVIR